MKNSFTGHLARVFGLLVAIFIVCSGGRLNSSDAHAQLQQSMILAVTGKVKTFDPPSDTVAGQYWIGNHVDGFYEKQDPGNMLLMLPSTWIAYHLILRHGGHPTRYDIEHPPLVANFLVAMTVTIVAAITCTFLYGLWISRFGSARTAAYITVGFIAGTYYAVYSKSAFDVGVGAACMSAILYYSYAALNMERALPSQQKALRLLPLFVAYAVICLFRAEMAPFLLCAIVAVCCVSLRLGRIQIASVIVAVVTCVGGLLLVNEMRTGTFALTAKTEGGSLGALFSGNFWHGIYGNTIAPNHGLFVFAPVLLMTLLLFNPATWKRMEENDRSLVIIFGALAVSYLLVISKLSNWSPTDLSWGPRFTVTILPIIYTVAILSAAAAGYWARTAVVALLTIGTAINVPAATVNSELAFGSDPRVTSPLAPRPIELETVWRALGTGLKGGHLKVTSKLLESPGSKLSSGFPDIWWIRAFVHSADSQRLMLLLLPIIFMLLFILIRGALSAKFDALPTEQTQIA